MRDTTNRLIRRYDRVAILPAAPHLRDLGHEYGDVTKIGRKWVHVMSNAGRIVQVSAADLRRIN